MKRRLLIVTSILLLAACGSPEEPRKKKTSAAETEAEMSWELIDTSSETQHLPAARAKQGEEKSLQEYKEIAAGLINIWSKDQTMRVPDKGAQPIPQISAQDFNVAMDDERSVQLIINPQEGFTFYGSMDKQTKQLKVDRFYYRSVKK